MELKGKKIIVLGLGVSGISALKLCLKKGALVYAVSSGSPEAWKDKAQLERMIHPDRMFNQDSAEALDSLKGTHLVIKSPGVPWENSFLEKARELNIEIIGEVELAALFISAPILSVTGTNGKTTTVSMIGDALSNAGLEVFVGGNIGIPPCDLVLENKKVDVVVLELSSFQLETMKKFHSDVGVILNLSPSHGERYEKPDDYARAKFELTKNMRTEDVMILLPQMAYISEWESSIECELKYADESVLANFSLEKFRLVGIHNLQNLIFCIQACREICLRLDTEKKIDLDKALQKTIDNFMGIEHRVEKVNSSKWKNVFNDAKSTNWDATKTAISSMSKLPRPLALILGGQLRGHNDLPPAEFKQCLKQNVDNVFLFGESGKLLGEEIPNSHYFETLEEIERFIIKSEFAGTILFSPAFPSFDQFENYAKRGEAFKKIFS